MTLKFIYFKSFSSFFFSLPVVASVVFWPCRKALRLELLRSYFFARGFRSICRLTVAESDDGIAFDPVDFFVDKFLADGDSSFVALVDGVHHVQVGPSGFEKGFGFHPCFGLDAGRAGQNVGLMYAVHVGVQKLEKKRKLLLNLFLIGRF